MWWLWLLDHVIWRNLVLVYAQVLKIFERQSRESIESYKQILMGHFDGILENKNINQKCR